MTLTNKRVTIPGAVGENRRRIQVLEAVAAASPPPATDLAVTDGITTVDPTDTIDFTSGATVTDGGGGLAQVAITAGGGGAVTQLSRTVLAMDTASFDITGISSGYNHLQVVLKARYDGGGGATLVNMRLNNDSGSSYSAANVAATSGGPLATSTTSGTSARIGAVPGSAETAGMAAVIDLMIMDYSDTTFKKQWAGVGMRADSMSVVVKEDPGGVWDNTSVVNRITIFPGSGNFVTGSSLTIYGII